MKKYYTFLHPDTKRARMVSSKLMGWRWEPVNGLPIVIPGFENLDLFLHEWAGEYRISERSTGCCMSKAEHPELAYAKAMERLQKEGTDKAEAIISSFPFRPPDVENPEPLEEEK